MNELEFAKCERAQPRHGGTKNPAAQALALILALAFLALGSIQVCSPKQDVFNLARLGIPEWMVSMMGFAEIGGGVLLIIPSTVAVAANGLGMIMAGAVLAHLNHDENRAAVLPLVLLTFLNIIAYVQTFGVLWPASTRVPQPRAQTILTQRRGGVETEKTED